MVEHRSAISRLVPAWVPPRQSEDQPPAQRPVRSESASHPSIGPRAAETTASGPRPTARRQFRAPRSPSRRGRGRAWRSRSRTRSEIFPARRGVSPGSRRRERSATRSDENVVETRFFCPIIRRFASSKNAAVSPIASNAHMPAFRGACRTQPRTHVFSSQSNSEGLPPDMRPDWLSRQLQNHFGGSGAANSMARIPFSYSIASSSAVCKTMCSSPGEIQVPRQGPLLPQGHVQGQPERIAGGDRNRRNYQYAPRCRIDYPQVVMELRLPRLVIRTGADAAARSARRRSRLPAVSPPPVSAWPPAPSEKGEKPNGAAGPHCAAVPALRDAHRR